MLALCPGRYPAPMGYIPNATISVFLPNLSLSMSPNPIPMRRGEIPTYPATSLTTSRTKAVRLLRCPLVRETRGLETRGVVFYNPGKGKARVEMSASIVC